ncbi:MAG: hypothetical protein O9346_17405 [Leptospiraceae bacterium]|jgi:hypothetical protein|nr:hypothetical protein [Leptospiraceae bacterium]
MAVMKPKAPKKIKIPVALTQELYDDLKAYAESQNRSMSGQLVWILREKLGKTENESND